MSPFSSIPDAIAALQQGRMIVVVDDEDRENEGDLIASAEHVTEDQMAFLIHHTSGIVFLAITNEIADRLRLPPMVPVNTAKRGTPFTVSIEAREGIETGVSAKDRVTTVRTAIRPDASPHDLARPGHIFPLRADDGGVLKRAGHTEATVDLMQLAGLRPGGVGAELMHEDGTMMRLPALEAFAQEHDFPLISIADLIAERHSREHLIKLEAEANLETHVGLWRIKVYSDSVSKREHIALIRGDIHPAKPTLVRVHSECLTGDILHSQHCDCGWQLDRAMHMIAQEGMGVIVYMRHQEGRGIGLSNKIRAYALQQEQGLDTVEANEKLGFPPDARNYGIGAQILHDVGVGNIRLLTNNPRKISGLKGFNLEIVEQVPIAMEAPPLGLLSYLTTKKNKLGHLLNL